METDRDQIVDHVFGDVDVTELGPPFIAITRRWFDASSSDALPSRSLVDPGWVGRLISSSLLMKVEGDDLRHRIVGQQFISYNSGFDPTGKSVRELFATRPVARVLYPEYMRVVSESVPGLISLRYQTVNDTTRHSKILLLPFTDQDPPDKSVAYLLGIFHFDDQV